MHVVRLHAGTRTTDQPINRSTQQPGNEKQTMAMLTEGNWKCKVLDGNVGLKKDEKKQNDPGLAHVTINVELIEGPDKGRRQSYEKTIDGKTAMYARKAMEAVGWQGKTSASFKDDVAAWIKSTGGESWARVAHILIKNGPKAGTQFAKIDAIGMKPQVLHQATDAAGQERMSDADRELQRALEATGGGGNYDEPPPQDEEIPFATSSMSAEPSPISRLLR